MENKQTGIAPNIDKLLNAFPWFVFSLAITLLVVISFVDMDIVIAANLKNYSIYVAVNALSNWSIYFAFKQRSYINGVSNTNGAYYKNFNNYLEDKCKIYSSQSFSNYISFREDQLKQQYIKDTIRNVGVETLQEVLHLNYKNKKMFPSRDQRSRIYNVQHNIFPCCGWTYNAIMYLGQDSNASKAEGLLAYQDVDLHKKQRIVGKAYSSKGFYTIIGAMFAGSIAGTMIFSSDNWIVTLIKIFISILLFILAINSGNLLGKKLVVIDKDTLGSASITIGQYEEWFKLESLKPTIKDIQTTIKTEEEINNE